MANFKYEQGEDNCSIQNKGKCNDEFLYSTLSSWVGIGQEAQAQIRLTPVPSKFNSQVMTQSSSQMVVTPSMTENKVVDAKKEETAPVVA